MGLRGARWIERFARTRVEPSVTDRDTWSWVALCSDGRWHKVDAFDRKLATTAELLDEEALVTALRAARAAEVEAAASMDCAERRGV